jgi:hypothetical protein
VNSSNFSETKKNKNGGKYFVKFIIFSFFKIFSGGKKNKKKEKRDYPQHAIKSQAN